MKHHLFTEIDKFIDWANSNYDLPHDEIGSDWEFDYPGWQSVYDAFQQFIKDIPSSDWNEEQQEKLLYILARDNESEFIAENLLEDAVIKLTEKAVKSNTLADAKWQLAIQLYRLQNKERAFTFLEKFINDTHEYVVRRSLMEMAKMQHPETEKYCEKLWDKNIYGQWEEYQRIAILFSLNEIKSGKLPYYIEQAKKDGRKYLVDNALKLEKQI